MTQEVKIHLPKHNFKVGDYLCYVGEFIGNDESWKECEKKSEFYEDIFQVCRHKKYGLTVLQVNDLFAVVANTQVSVQINIDLNRIKIISILELATKFTLASHVNLIFV